MGKTIKSFIIMSVVWVLTGCTHEQQVISEKAILKDRSEFIKAAKQCYKSIQHNPSQVFNNQTCTNLAKANKDSCEVAASHNPNMMFSPCAPSMQTNLVLAIRKARQEERRMLFDKKEGW